MQTYKLEETTPRAFWFLMQCVYEGKITLLTVENIDVQETMVAMDPPSYEGDPVIGDDLETISLLCGGIGTC